jgi:hypothetical protein
VTQAAGSAIGALSGTLSAFDLARQYMNAGPVAGAALVGAGFGVQVGLDGGSFAISASSPTLLASVDFSGW